jgi:hypothetical protein
MFHDEGRKGWGSGVLGCTHVSLVSIIIMEMRDLPGEIWAAIAGKLDAFVDK